MKRVLYPLLTLLVLYGCVKEMHEGPPSGRLENASTLLPEALENGQQFYRQHVTSSPFYQENDLAAQRIDWDYSAFFITTEGDMGLSVSIRDRTYSRSRYLLLLIYEGETAQVKKALYMRFNPTTAYYEKYKDRDYTRFSGHAEFFDLSGNNLGARACFDGVWKKRPATAQTRCDIEAVTIKGWICRT